jgi:hypothetical protein
MAAEVFGVIGVCALIVLGVGVIIGIIGLVSTILDIDRRTRSLPVIKENTTTIWVEMAKLRERLEQERGEEKECDGS